MKIILLANMIIKGRMCKAGETVEMDAKHADALQFMDLAYIPDSKSDQLSENGEEEQAKEKPVEKKAPRGRKAASK